MAHDDIPLLKKLIGLLDYPDNDIYLHLDKKCNEDISDIQKGILSIQGFIEFRVWM